MKLMTWDDMKLATWDDMKVVTCFDLTCDDVKLVYLVNLYKVTRVLGKLV